MMSLFLRPITLLSLLASLLAITPCAFATGESREFNHEIWIGSRPNIENYQDEQAFVADVLAWEQQKAALIRLHKAGALPSPNDNINEDPHDWHHITGPEDLEVAIRNADGYEQPNYREKYRFNRTTHISFPLDAVAPELDSRSNTAQKNAAQKQADGDRDDQLTQHEPLVMIDESGYLVLAPVSRKDQSANTN